MVAIDVLPLANTALLAGIFYRMGNLKTDIKATRARIRRLEKASDDVEDYVGR